MSRSVQLALNHNLSLRTIIVLVFVAIGVFFAPFLEGLTEWTIKRNITFEDGSVTLPALWTSGEKGHLPSVRQSGMTLLFPSESTVTIDPFAERWPADKLEKTSDLWLQGHGSPVVAGKFKDPLTGTPITFSPEARCVSPAADSGSEQRSFVFIAFPQIPFTRSSSLVSETQSQDSQAYWLKHRKSLVSIRAAYSADERPVLSNNRQTESCTISGNVLFGDDTA